MHELTANTQLIDSTIKSIKQNLVCDRIFQLPNVKTIYTKCCLNITIEYRNQGKQCDDQGYSSEVFKAKKAHIYITYKHI
jgi:hypothetical protein